ncbi:MAG TPA: hypothetical protein VFJ90_05530, partial [Candidatus Didemnitutus sp.]|nr:hypothetical protein [Candidatus Didemnitutus sp.]
MNGSKDYYLSEFAVSDKNGGGLSILRTLEKDISTFDRFVHVSEFATRIEPIMPRFADRQLNLHEFYPVPKIKLRSARDYFERTLARFCRIKPPLAWLYDQWSAKASDHVLRELDLVGCKWLVIPQSALSVLVM